MNYTLHICWLYPELMSTYGDRGNIICLEKRCLWRGIDIKITSEIKGADLVFGGGAQDRQQGIVASDLVKKKNILQEMFEHDVPGLFVCGAPQLLGHYYETADGKKIPCLGIFDMITKNPGLNRPRCIGNLVAKISSSFIVHRSSSVTNHEPVSTMNHYVVGFENHGGRTFLGKGVRPLAEVLSGFGNNGEDKTEGAIFHNCLATYSHGPFLPKNPHIADWLIRKALEVKYQKEVELEPLDDTLEWQAHDFILKKYG